MFDLNALLRRAWIMSGRFNGNEIVKSNFYHFLHHASILISTVASVKAFFLVLFPYLKFHLIELHMIEGALVSRLFNIGASLIHISMLIKSTAFYKFNKRPKGITFLKYLLYKTPKELRYYYEIDKKYADQFFKYKTLFWYIANSAIIIFIILLEALILRCTFVAFMKHKVTCLESIYLTVPLTIITCIAYCYSSYSSVSGNTIFILNCIFISLRLKDLCRKFEKVIQNVSLKKESRDRNEKVEHLITQMHSILKFYKDNQCFGDAAISGYYLVILLIFLFYPYMMFFEKNTPVFQIVLILGYINTFISASLPIVLINTMVNERIKEYENIVYTKLTYSLEPQTKMKLQAIYLIDQPNSLLTYNCYGLFNYTKGFLLDWVLNSITMVFLFYAAKFSYKW